MHLLQRFNQFVRMHRLFTPEHTLVLGVSGGVDSMVLAELCRQSGYRLVIAHCNFSLRGDESDGDEQSVQAYATVHGLPFEVRRFDTMAFSQERKVSVQVAARELRYAWFHQLLKENGGEGKARILTAHHLDDNLETMLMNFFKGTGIAGLRGIRPLNGAIARPLLFARKADLTEWANNHQLGWRNDHSNTENKYTRNFFRNQLLPLLGSVFPAVEENLADNQARFADIERLYQESLTRHLKRLLVKQGDGFRVPVKLLLASEVRDTVAWEIFRRFGFSAASIPEVLALCESETGQYISSATHRVIRHRDWLVIAGLAPEGGNMLVLDAPGTYSFGGGSLLLEKQSYNGENPDLGTDIVLVNAAELSFPLVLRPARPGDYFYPLGMPKKKKVARFLTDRKMPKDQKERVWVIESSNRICWLPGLRLDHRFRVKASTTQVYRLTLKSSGTYT